MRGSEAAMHENAQNIQFIRESAISSVLPVDSHQGAECHLEVRAP